MNLAVRQSRCVITITAVLQIVKTRNVEMMDAAGVVECVDVAMNARTRNVFLQLAQENNAVTTGAEEVAGVVDAEMNARMGSVYLLLVSIKNAEMTAVGGVAEHALNFQIHSVIAVFVNAITNVQTRNAGTTAAEGVAENALVAESNA